MSKLGRYLSYRSSIHVYSLICIIQADRSVPLRRPVSRHTSIASITGSEANGHRQLRRRGSGACASSTVGEGSNSRKRGLSPPGEGDIAGKRPRTSESSGVQTRGATQRDTRASRLLGATTVHEKRRQEPEDVVGCGCPGSFADLK